MDEDEWGPGQDTGEQPTPEQTPEPAPRELYLLSPFRLPTQSALYLANEDVACFLNGHAALWHPALLLHAAGPPRIASPYDHEQPTPGHVYAVPENPPPVLPDDWDERVRAAGALAFRASTDRATTLANLKEVLRAHLEKEAADPEKATAAYQALGLLELPPEEVEPFFGIGFGHIQLEALCEAMSHDNLLDAPELWQDVQSAAVALADPHAGETCGEHLKSAAQRLLSAREVLYPVAIHLLDLSLLTEENAVLALPNPAAHELPFNVIAPAMTLERLAQILPDRLDWLRQRVAAEAAEVCGGCYAEREDALLPVESQLWNLRKGLDVSRDLLGSDIRIFARQRFGFVPQTPSLLQAVGLSRMLLLSFDESVLPSHRAPIVNWPATDGKQVDAYCRAPHAADNPQTFFHVAHYLHETIMADQAATLALLHTGRPAPWYFDWQALARLAPVLGEWTTLSRYFDEVSAGDYASPTPADELRGDYLSERTGDQPEESSSSGADKKVYKFQPDEETRRHPVSAFAAHARARRRLDAAWTFAALHRSLAGQGEPHPLEARLVELEDQLEAAAPFSPDKETRRQGDKETEEATTGSVSLSASLAEVFQQSAELLAQRLLARAEKEEPGYLILNPCSFARRVILELEGLTAPVAVAGPVKSCQMDGGTCRLVAEVPALGFAWFPRTAGAPMPAKMRLADDRCVRNEFFEAEVDGATGGLKGIRDHKTRVGRVGQQLVFNPGSSLRVKEVKTTSTGPAYGEIVTEGVLLDEQEQVLATFRQRFRAWLGRPVLDMRIEIVPEHLPKGYPWHAYYGCRFAWRDERATLLRGVNGLSYITAQTRPESPDFLDIRLGRQSTVLLTGGLPFHQRHGSRMVDIILVPEGETAQTFDLAVGLDRDYPMLTAFGMVSPVAVVPAPKGPPHVGATGWLFHIDVPNLLLTSLRPAPGGADGVVAHLLECGNHAGHCELRCVRDPQGVDQVNVRGEVLAQLGYQGDAVMLDVAEGEFVQLRIDFTREQPPEQPSEEPLPEEGTYD
jgi:hypothetical protein